MVSIRDVEDFDLQFVAVGQEFPRSAQVKLNSLESICPKLRRQKINPFIYQVAPIATSVKDRVIYVGHDGKRRQMRHVFALLDQLTFGQVERLVTERSKFAAVLDQATAHKSGFL